MTREEMMKKSWKAYEIINYFPKRKDGYRIECLLLAVDFDNELFKLEPINKIMYEDQSFWTHCDYCQKGLKLKK